MLTDCYQPGASLGAAGLSLGAAGVLGAGVALARPNGRRGATHGDVSR